MKIDTKKIFISLLLISLWGGVGIAQELEDYLKIAAENNPKLQSAYTQFEAALQQSPQVSSLPDPTLTVSAFGRMVETRLGAQEARFSLMQMFPWFGTLKTKKEAADLLAEARFQEYLAMRADLFFEIKKAYAQLFAIEKTIALKEENLDILDSYRELSLSKFRSGSSKMVNVVRVDIKRDEALTEIELEKEQLESLKKQFNLLLNRDRQADVAIQDTLIFNPEIQNEIINPEEAFKMHPELAKFDREREAYESRAETAQKSGLPNFGIGVDYSIISKRRDANPPMNGQDAIMPMFSVSLPIFRKKYKAAEKEAELMQEAAIQNKEARENQLLSEFEQTVYDLNKADKLLKLYERQIESSNQANRLLVSAFSNNDGDFEEVLQMNQDILMLKTQQIEALKTGFTAQAKMDYLSAKTENYDEKN
ncbi:Outer membrane protein TolC [Salegentibacter agarivorans]|jgi:outer membrane protein TolC|uniref:Outer membrane protein TolC n=1 Tax=Salegentibacter agarivorans TaxID=345907 RepID=A0A1I2KRM4_9FLAO|nr:TolC family protein [Salegentibacter agarivorans]SFF69595.1 Outer membrane protein TolC [Salegentibacter agarivorans]